MSTGNIVSVGGDVETSHFIDEEQAEAQIDLCDAQLKEEQARGMPVSERLAFLKKARELLELGQFTKAFLFAVRARGIAVERLP